MSNDDDHAAAFAAFMAAGHFRDAVAQACDSFDPQRKEAVPLGAGTVFTEFRDASGSAVRVVLSSASMRECCRVFIRPSEVMSHEEETPSGMVHPAWVPTDLHLCRCMAAELRRALDEAFDYTLDEQPRCTTEDVE